MRKITKEQKEAAVKIMEERKISELFMDEKGNFFLTRNNAELAANSKTGVSHLKAEDLQDTTVQKKATNSKKKVVKPDTEENSSDQDKDASQDTASSDETTKQ